ncbi:hypothetical protein [Streptomyces sp. NPDC005573]|uniref:hypothetical protein n=1 Tax=Streptomyces sp. NPDC005573 TaxID=3156890 RepID=UPI00339FA6EC
MDDRRTRWGRIVSLAALFLSACSGPPATNVEEAGRLAESQVAKEARHRTEERLRATVREYVDHTSLHLGLLVLQDTCAPGAAKQWIDANGNDTYEVRCSMEVTAYFGADRRRIEAVLDELLTAGERAGSTTMFTHVTDERILDYYRHPGRDGQTEPGVMAAPDRDLFWDTLYQDRPPVRVSEPRRCYHALPPPNRCLKEPETATVAAIRQRYGIVFELPLHPQEYFKVPRK